MKSQAQSKSQKDASKDKRNQIRVAQVNADIKQLAESIARQIPDTGPTVPGKCDLTPRTPFGADYLASDECRAESGELVRLVSIKSQPNRTIALVRREGDAFLGVVTLEHPEMTTMYSLSDLLDFAVTTASNAITKFQTTTNSGVGSGGKVTCNGGLVFCPYIINNNTPNPGSKAEDKATDPPPPPPPPQP